MYVAGFGLNSAEWFTCMYISWTVSGVRGGSYVGSNTLVDKTRWLPTQENWGHTEASFYSRLVMSDSLQPHGL